MQQGGVVTEDSSSSWKPITVSHLDSEFHIKMKPCKQCVGIFMCENHLQFVSNFRPQPDTDYNSVIFLLKYPVNCSPPHSLAQSLSLGCLKYPPRKSKAIIYVLLP